MLDMAPTGFVLLSPIDARADALLSKGATTNAALDVLLVEYPHVHMDTLAERVALASILYGRSL